MIIQCIIYSYLNTYCTNYEVETKPSHLCLNAKSNQYGNSEEKYRGKTVYVLLFPSFAIRDLIKIVLCIEVTFFDLLQGSEIRVFSFSACFDQFIEST